MAGDFIPSRDADLLSWAKANSAVITANPTSFFLTTAIATTYAGLVTAFEDAFYAAKTENAGKMDRIRKDQARKDLVAYARAWARLVQGQLTVTIEQRGELGISLRDNPGTPIEAPTVKPVMEILAADGRRFKMLVKQIGSDGKSKLSRSTGANVFSYVGTSPNPDISKWEWHGLVSRGEFFLELGTSVPAGSQVWFRSAWATARGLNGPLSTAISGYVAGALGDSVAATQPVETSETPMLKAA